MTLEDSPLVLHRLLLEQPLAGETSYSRDDTPGFLKSLRHFQSEGQFAPTPISVTAALSFSSRT
jgi:hypothetical protein